MYRPMKLWNCNNRVSKKTYAITKSYKSRHMLKFCSLVMHWSLLIINMYKQQQQELLQDHNTMFEFFFPFLSPELCCCMFVQLVPVFSHPTQLVQAQYTSVSAGSSFISSKLKKWKCPVKYQNRLFEKEILYIFLQTHEC